MRAARKRRPIHVKRGKHMQLTVTLYLDQLDGPGCNIAEMVDAVADKLSDDVIAVNGSRYDLTSVLYETDTLLATALGNGGLADAFEAAVQRPEPKRNGRTGRVPTMSDKEVKAWVRENPRNGVSMTAYHEAFRAAGGVCARTRFDRLVKSTRRSAA